MPVPFSTFLDGGICGGMFRCAFNLSVYNSIACDSSSNPGAGTMITARGSCA